jgi:nitrogen fixation/metabolism regulation signal transduction histidine kinase
MEIIVCILIGAALITAGVMLVINGGKRQQKPMLIGGWVLTIAAIVGTVVGVILFAGLGEQSLTSAFITYAFPALMFIGFVVAIGLGVGNLVKGYQKDQDGNLNNNKIIAGWALLILAIVLVLAIVIPLTIVFDQQSSGDANEIRFM